MSGNVSKHVALVGELSRIVAAQQLLAAGELEQNLATLDQHTADLEVLESILLFHYF